MKVTVALSDKEMREVCQLAGEKKKGPAIRKILTDALRMQRRREMTEKYASGEWSMDLEPWETMRKREREHARKLAELWTK